MRKFRKGAGFYQPDQCSTPLDRNTKARIIDSAEKLELRTKQKGRKAGLLGQTGLQVLRCLLHGFHNSATGRCDPGYTAIQGRTGLCRQAVADAIKRLENTGIIKVFRRLKRDGWRVVQTTNAYLFPAEKRPIPPSLDDREEPFVQTSYPWKRSSALLSVPMSRALQALGERVAERIAQENEMIEAG